jgi:hypothetical protein
MIRVSAFVMRWSAAALFAVSIIGPLCFSGPAPGQTPPSTISHDNGQSENTVEKAFAAKLRAKYSARLSFSTQRAEEIVEDFDIDCHRSDRRFLPLLNVLFSQMAMMDMANTWLTVEVENRDDEVRVFDILQGKHGPISQPDLVFEINKWSELSVHGIRVEAVMNECLDQQAPCGRHRRVIGTWICRRVSARA